MPAWPDDNYIVLLGRAVYGIASIEGFLIFDLPHAPGVPADLTPQAMSGRTTTQIGQAFQAAAKNATNANTAQWLELGGDRLVALGLARNAVMHARPATIGGQQRLNRWRVTAKGTESFEIDEAHLENLILEIEEAGTEIHAVRPPLP